MRMRFRTDGSHYADLKTYGHTFDEYYKGAPSVLNNSESRKCWEESPKAEPGDVWRIRWSKEGGDGPVAGYAICCIKCGHVHHWTTSRNCSQKVTRSYVDTNTGQTVEYESCVHNGEGSCWQWSGSAEDGTLTASPSLLVIQSEDQPCNFHGHLVDGDIHDG